MRRTLLISALAVLLSASAYAGEMQYPAPAPPPPGPVTTNASLVAPGEDAAQDSFTQTVLNVLGSVLALV